jgi:hypothetical protein
MGSTRVVTCNSVTCAVGQVCCASDAGGDNSFIGCADEGTCGASEFEIECDGPEDCDAGEICCGTRPGSYYSAVACQAAAGCSGSNASVMCGGDSGPSATLCVNSAGPCNASSDLPGYYYCTD